MVKVLPIGARLQSQGDGHDYSNETPRDRAGHGNPEPHVAAATAGGVLGQ